MPKSNRRTEKYKRFVIPRAWGQPAKLAPLLLAAIFIGLLTYWPAFSATAFYLDDDLYLDTLVIQQPSWTTFGRFFSEVFEPSVVSGYYHPLTLTSVMLDFLDPAVATGNLMPFHRTSLALHLLNTGLAIILLYLLFDNKIVAGIAGLLFGLHPMNADAILWFAERKTVLSAFFALSALVFYVLYARQPNWKRYAATLGLYVLALLSKPTALPLPLLLLVLDWWPLRRLQTGAVVGAPPGLAVAPTRTALVSWRRVLLEKVPFLLIGALSAVITLISQQQTVGNPPPPDNPALRLVLKLVYTPVFYLFKILWPANLVADYPFPAPLILANPIIWAGVIGTIALIVALVISVRYTPAGLAGWLFFFIAVFPALGIVSFTDALAANRFVYLPMIGLLLPLAWALNTAWRAAGRANQHNLILAAGVVLGLLEIGVTAGYEAHWQNTEKLLQYFLTQTPDEWKLHSNLGREFARQDDLEAALVHYQEAARLAPTQLGTHLNLGKVWYQTGNYAAAKQEFTYILQQNQTFWAVHLLQGKTLREMGDFELAINEMKEADRLRPGEAEIHYNLGVTFAKQGNLTEAIQEYRETLRLDPSYIDARRALEALGQQP